MAVREVLRGASRYCFGQVARPVQEARLWESDAMQWKSLRCFCIA